MKRLFRRRMLAVASAVAGTALLIPSGAGAVGAKPSDTCTLLTVPLHGLGTVSGCKSNRRGPTSNKTTRKNGSGTVLVVSPDTLQITWNPPYEGSTAANPATTTLQGTLTPIRPDEDEKESKNHSCPATTNEVTWIGTVTQDTTNPGGQSDVNAPFTAELCQTPGNFNSLEPHSKLKIFGP
jgi:hypothetical protein